MPKNRDTELDSIMKGLEDTPPDPKHVPFMHRSDKLDIGPGSLCWLDGSRRCGADCTAFNPDELDEHGHATDSPNKCLILTYMGQQGAAALSVIAVGRVAAKKAQDERREASPPVPKVGGKKEA